MSQVIETLGQAALLLVYVVVILAMLYVVAWLLQLVIRAAKSLQQIGGRPPVGRVGSRKW